MFREEGDRDLLEKVGKAMLLLKENAVHFIAVDGKILRGSHPAM